MSREWLFDPDFEAAWVAEVGGVPVGHIAVKRGYGGAPIGWATGRPAAETLGITRFFVEFNAAAIALCERRGWVRLGSGVAEWFGPDGPHPTVHLYVGPAVTRRTALPLT